MTKRPYTANEFAVWRACKSVDWQCTVQDVAQQTGLHRDTVSRIIRSRGWKLEGDTTENHIGFEHRMPVDAVMRAGVLWQERFA